MRRNKLVSLAVGALAVTTFAACSDDETETPGGDLETPDTGLAPSDTGADLGGVATTTATS